MSEITWKQTTLEEVCKKLDAEPERGVILYIDGVPLIEILKHDYPQLFHNEK